ncbi:phosphoglycolate phosphatase [Aidingimonas halophila]|uniref:Phosphoglycolate phosphatase n=1 Tax=Aidingimonas halophila TaxID=574349 RepID=A0A1H3H7P4_9GAMM|nr:phosphoglycolate phosphatase [Aidingimonas halophila]GHC36701.1 phosphoglycolate phosphatase 1 [Aidingimonas halophila]SDY10669.1 phosphoglycolate phosphatase [Aidingimonas halophila]
MHPLLRDMTLVVFDLDGTLVDSVPDLAAAVDASLVDLGLAPRGASRVRDWVGNGSRVLMERAVHDSSGRVPDEAFLERAHDAFLARYRQHPVQHTRLYPGVREALEGLAGHRFQLALVTNKPQMFIQPILEHFGIAGYFRIVLGGDLLPDRKPHPAPLWYVAETCRVSPERCLMVGDSCHDIEAGKRAGFRTLAVTYGYNHGEPVAASQPDGVVESLAELV